MSRVLPTLMLAILLPACTMAPRYERPAPPVPATLPQGDAYPQLSEAALPAVGYADLFTDERLRTLIGQALANNRDLRVAAANIAVARARYRIQRAELLPVIDAGAGLTRRDAANSSTGGGQGPGTQYSADVGTTAFEIDLFGRIRSLSDAALNDYFATQAAERATRVTLVGDIATAWLTYAADRSLLALAEDTAHNAERSTDLTRKRLQGGIAPRSDLRQAEQVLAQAQSDLAESRTALAQDVNALQLLVGASFDPALLPGPIEEVAGSFREVPAGLDSAVLLRRPDVLQAEYSLKAANAQIGAARAALFPRISLTALTGFASGALDALFDKGNFTWSVSPGASWSIFSAGAARAGVKQSQAERDAALATYEKAIQTAFRETADALARRGTIDEQLRADTALVDASADNYALAELRYRGGVDSYLQNLDAQRSLYTAQRALVATRLVKAANLVTLYRVLGGDREAEAPAS
jgi:multidrug efflux system outer membrane protein